MRGMKISSKKKVFARYLRKAQTDAEQLLWRKLRNRQFLGIKFRRQQPIGDFIVDFVSFEKRLIVEVDGGQHNEAGYLYRDCLRTRFLEDCGFTVVRFWNNEIMDNLNEVLETLTLALSRRERETRFI